MKTSKGTCFITLAAAIGLLLAAIAKDTLTAAQAADSSTGALTNTTAATNLQAEATDQSSTAPSTNTATESPDQSVAKSGVNREAMIVFGHDAELKAGDTADVVVVIGGSARIHGKVRDTVTAVGGSIEVDGEIAHEAVAVLGDIHVASGGVINGDAVSVGGKLDIAKGATVKGQTSEIDVGAALPQFKGLRKWFVHCVLMMRPLAPQVGWVWVIAAGFFLFYLLIAALFPRPVQACVEELTRRPATTFLMGLLTKLLWPLVVVILAVTVLGLLVVPFLLVALLLGFIVGKVAILEWIGFKLGRQFGSEALQKPLLALVVGSIIMALIYMVPVLGLLMLGVTSIWGLGAAVTAAFGGLRREMPEKRAPAPGAIMPAAAAFASVPGRPADVPGPSVPFTASTEPSGTATATLPATPPVLPEVLSYPKASFWERLGAGFLDFVLIGIAGHFVGGPPLSFLVALAYFAAMWTWKGTTIGGIVLNLKVVRMDGQVITFPVALVRALAAAFSIIVLFLGFLWIAWDRDKQGWHDKIAGTAVLRLPRGTPLVCL